MKRLSPGPYAFLHARLGAMKAELLPPALWEVLTQTGTFEEQRRLLAGTAYALWLGEDAEETVGRLRSAVRGTLRKIERSLEGSAVQFLRTWGWRDLLRNVKTVLRGKALGRSEAEIAADLPGPEDWPRFPMRQLLGCMGVEPALDLLEGTDLRGWVREARRIYRRDPTLFGLDAALDRVYYVALWRQVERLAPTDREAVAPLVALEIDQVNLLWLLRYRLNYGLSPAEAYYLLAPVIGRLDTGQLKQIAQADSLEAALRRLRSEPFRSLTAGCGSVWQVEVGLWRYRARLARRVLRCDAFRLGEALALLELVGMEIRDLIAVLEGTRFGATRQQIREQLTGTGLA